MFMLVQWFYKNSLYCHKYDFPKVKPKIDTVLIEILLGLASLHIAQWVIWSLQHQKTWM